MTVPPSQVKRFLRGKKNDRKLLDQKSDEEWFVVCNLRSRAKGPRLLSQ